MDSKDVRILVIDDEPVNLQLMGYMLKPMYQTAFSTRGSKAVELTKKIQPDLILLDVMMPEMDGFEVCRNLKASPETSNIPVIFLTAKIEKEDIIRGFSLGAVDYITKPFRKEELMARVKTHIRLRHSEEALRIALAESESAKEKAESALKQNLKMQEKINKDLEAGAAIQKKFLTGQQETSELLNSAGFNFIVYNQPYSTVSGDFFYPKNINSQVCGLFFADTCGHGLPAALISMRILGLLQSLPVSDLSPCAYLQAVNQDISDIMPPGRFITAEYLVFQDSQVLISNAGQPFPVFISRDNIKEIDIKGAPLGVLDDPVLSEAGVIINSGERIILYSDGVIEIENNCGQMLGRQQFLEFLKTNALDDIDTLKSKIINMLDEFKGDAHDTDDITFIIIEKK
ncbi:Two component system response regulator, PPM-type phosphatase domain-containing protein [Desulfonema limicola]|uniref:Two component system response regulator, PPM-type phosphatase domain-containing protein n=1 Tax=Desulfonema limicola TaxID=45656 RepID=A0A975BCJ3_9BACT|nr:SpoIIE family protein phosphatase [Desulfonema limicola]QTA82790.1 Two component system response regulator, PPM-type phosphatase domain-containing protein [Desulfonema limicola]